MSRKTLLTTLAAAAMMAAQSDNFYRYGQRKRYPPMEGTGFSNKAPKPDNSHQLREFSIKGNKIMAYSRKDAVIRLKHLKKI